MKRILLLTVIINFSCSKDEGAALCIFEHLLETNEAINVSDTSAILNGSIIVVSENCYVPSGSQQGFVYSTNNQPDINDNLIISSGEQINGVITDLIPNTTYYARSFIASSSGEYYGNEISFTTLSPSSEINYGINEFDMLFDLSLIHI